MDSDTIQTISADMAKLYGLPRLYIEARLDEAYLENLSPFGAVNFKDCIVRYSAKAKPWHMAHEVAHVYQCRYKLPLHELSACTAPREVDAMLKTSQWCLANNCPVHSTEYIFKKGGCDE